MNDEDFLNQVNKALDQQVESLDGETLSRLNRARQTAIQQQGRAHKSHRLTWLPVSGLAAAILLGSLFMFRSADIDIISDVDEIDIIASSDKLELFEQLDFYMWLLEEDADAV
jgi:type VI protein secretion system component VasF